jgi:hypothetical protein
MPGTQSGKPRSSVRKAPPAKIPKAPATKPVAAAAPKPVKAAAPKPIKAAAPKARKPVNHKSSVPTIGSIEWQQRLATAAYLRAEARGFVGGSPEQDWLEAEAELMAAQAAPAK